MHEDSSAHNRLERTREAREFIIYPSRQSIQIEDGDWKRWLRKISNIPKRESIYRDIAFACFGISVPSLISVISTSPDVTQLPRWISTTYLVVGAVTLAIGVVCLVFDQKMGKVVSSTTEEVLQDMNEVRDRSVRSEERTFSPNEETKSETSVKSVTQGQLIIESAIYGVQGKTADVSQLLKSKVFKGKLEICASNQELGGDPAKGDPKELVVVYYYNGKKFSRTIPEDEMLILP